MKCPRCGYFEHYWLKMNYDKEAEYAKRSDVSDPELAGLKAGEIMEKNGHVYKGTPKYLERLPTEIFRARGMTFTKPPNYWDATNFDSHHWRTSNERLDSY